jgi:hypothetical protein
VRLVLSEAPAVRQQTWGIKSEIRAYASDRSIGGSVKIACSQHSASLNGWNLKHIKITPDYLKQNITITLGIFASNTPTLRDSPCSQQNYILTRVHTKSKIHSNLFITELSEPQWALTSVDRNIWTSQQHT